MPHGFSRTSPNIKKLPNIFYPIVYIVISVIFARLDTHFKLYEQVILEPKS